MCVTVSYGQEWLCHEGERWRQQNAGASHVCGRRAYGAGLGNDLVRDGFFGAQSGVGADLQLGEFFFAGWVALA